MYRNAVGMGGAMGEVNAQFEKKEDKGIDITGTAEEAMNNALKPKKVDPTETVRTSDTEARSVAQGKNSRKKQFKDDKKAIKQTKRQALSELDEGASVFGQGSKEIRANKRAAMRDLRNKERGEIRADRQARRIKKYGDKNNLTVGEATRAYEARKATLGSYNKKAMSETAADVKAYNDKRDAENLKANSTPANPADNLNKKVLGDGAQKVVSGISGPSMLDAPTQQAASEDSDGMGTYMLDSKNRRGR